MKKFYTKTLVRVLLPINLGIGILAGMLVLTPKFTPSASKMSEEAELCSDDHYYAQLTTSFNGWDTNDAYSYNGWDTNDTYSYDATKTSPS